MSNPPKVSPDFGITSAEVEQALWNSPSLDRTDQEYRDCEEADKSRHGSLQAAYI
jgi:hypothetical protein